MATATEIDRLVVTLIGNATGLTNTLNQATRQTRAAANDMTQAARTAERQVTRLISTTAAGMKSISSSFQSAGQTMRRFGIILSASVTAPLALLGKSAIREFSEFDKAMTNSLSIAQGVTPKIRKEMEATAMSMAEQGVFSATQVADAYYQLISAGYSLQASLKAVKVVEDFATAGAMNLEQSVKMLAKAQFAMGLASNDAETNMKNMRRVADVLAQGANMVTANIGEMTEALTNAAAPAAKLLGMSIEQTVAALQIYIQKGSSMATASEHLAIGLRLTQQAFAKHSKEWIAMGKSMGINMNIYDRVTGKIKPFADIVDMLSKALGSLSDRERTAALEALGFEALHQRAILPLIGAAEQMRENERQLKKTGEAHRIAQEQLTSFDAAAKKLLHTWQNIKIELGREIAPIILHISDLLKGAMAYWKYLNDETKWTTIRFAACAAAAGPLLLAFSALFSPAGLVVAGTAALVTLTGYLNGDVIGAFQSVANVIDKVFLGVLGHTIEMIKALKGQIESVIAVKRLQATRRENLAKTYGEPIAKMYEEQIKAQEEVEKKREALQNARRARQKRIGAAAGANLGGFAMLQMEFGDQQIREYRQKQFKAEMERIAKEHPSPEVGRAQGELESAQRNARAITKKIEDAMQRSQRKASFGSRLAESAFGAPMVQAFKLIQDKTQPAISSLEDMKNELLGLKKASEESSKALEEQTSVAVERFTDVQRSISDMTDKFKQQIAVQEEEAKHNYKLTGSQRTLFNKRYEMQQEFARGEKELQNRIDEQTAKYEEVAKGGNIMAKLFSAKDLQAAKKALDDYRASFAKATQGLDESKALAERTEELRKQKELFEWSKQHNPAKKFAEEMDKASRALAAGLITAEQYQKVVKGIRKEMQDQNGELKKTQDFLKTGGKIEAERYNRTNMMLQIAQHNAELASHGITLPTAANPANRAQSRRMAALKQIEKHNADRQALEHHTRRMRNIAENVAPSQEQGRLLRQEQDAYERKLRRNQEVMDRKPERLLERIAKATESTVNEIRTSGKHLGTRVYGPGRIQVLSARQREIALKRHARTIARLKNNMPAIAKEQERWEKQLANFAKRSPVPIAIRPGDEKLSQYSKTETKLLDRIAKAVETTAKKKDIKVEPANL